MLTVRYQGGRPDLPSHPDLQHGDKFVAYKSNNGGGGDPAPDRAARLVVRVAREALGGLPVPMGQVTALSVLAQVKFAGAGLGVAFFAIALLIASPGRRPLTLLVATLFLLFPAVNAYTVATTEAASGLILWMLLSLLAGAALLWQAAKALAPAGAHPSATEANRLPEGR